MDILLDGIDPLGCVVPEYSGWSLRLATIIFFQDRVGMAFPRLCIPVQEVVLLILWSKGLFYSRNRVKTPGFSNFKFAVIESNAVQHSKRRLTEFAFQRVVRNEDGTIVVSSPGPKSPAQPQLHAPLGPSVPLVRATRPGEEFEDARHTKYLSENNDSGKRPQVPGGAQVTGPSTGLSRNHPGMRRFHLESLDFDDSVAPDQYSGVVKKRKFIKPTRRIVVVERKPGAEGTTSTRVVPALDDLTSLIGDIRVSNDYISRAQEEARNALSSTPRKRHVISAAEKRWKEEKARQPTISTTRAPGSKQPAKTGDSIKDDPSTWDHNSDELADELAQIAMQLTGDLPIHPPKPAKMEPSSRRTIEPQTPKRALKYQPRLPKTPRNRSSQAPESPGKVDGGRAPVESDAMDVDDVVGVASHNSLLL